jgi:Ran GTPase-activating protein (RanGAP) involved in mRNA processing and transport
LLRLNLCGTEFTAKAGKHLLRVLTEKPNITCVKLAHNDIGHTGGQMLGAYLTSGSRLTVLDLSSTNIGSKALNAVRSSPPAPLMALADTTHAHAHTRTHTHTRHTTNDTRRTREHRLGAG